MSGGANLEHLGVVGNKKVDFRPHLDPPMIYMLCMMCQIRGVLELLIDITL